ncbi:hypothetical protein ASE00_10215 [Sphingomonas sp. Root710]|uniref:hypothetical protein n=1 Tax=Sphingomonas sp. Root710 TaxID=1736594 RepID=UPI0006F8D77B|nr:hypothetical protein [Sphingomonas sp. Root710]KRB82429.1 hypothetical protein ASE00_10215 [Sphingomonas sp. Root710]
MPHYLVAYDCNKPGQNYPDLIKHLEGYPNHWHIQKSAWIVGPASSALDVATAACQFLDSNDDLIVQAWTEDSAWWGYDDKGTEWLQSVM